MPLKDFSLLTAAALDLIQPGTLPDATLYELQCIIPEELLISALDLIDRDNVIKLTTLWGRSEYQILGSAVIHTVILEPRNDHVPLYCSCPAFACLVLDADSHVDNFMCQHILAAQIASRMLRFTENTLSLDDVAAVMLVQYTGA